MLVTGGAGYIGSHTVKALSDAGYRPVVLDNLSSGSRQAVRWGEFVHGDIRDLSALREVMTTFNIDSVIHFASLIEVGRSIVRPDLFYDCNVGGTASLLRAMADSGVGRLVFSSTAAVYGHGDGSALTETSPKDPVSPYGDTKLACERMIAAHAKAFGLSTIALRYFNAAGADPGGLIGEAHDPETHLIPLAIEAALGLGKPFTVFGADFGTPDGTCLRDYVHVTDLGSAHIAALQAAGSLGPFDAINVGMGRGWSVFEVIAAVERALGRPVPHQIGPRREGDPAILVADPSRAREQLRWTAQYSSLDHIVETAVRWRLGAGYKVTRDISSRPDVQRPVDDQVSI
ncbi:MAG: UDP-glucose 4-epimerase GalE [Verrucomicrobia bacterium]|nr:UDP-glucose 4-epimerase GalE [Verrucomicrobiota bacterium]